MSKLERVDLSDVGADARGWHLDPVAAAGAYAGTLGHVHVASLRPGSERGNHWHESSTEWLLVFGGPAKISWKAREGGLMGEEVVADAGPALFAIPPGVEHTVLNASNAMLYVFVFRDTREDDTRRVLAG